MSQESNPKPSPRRIFLDYVLIALGAALCGAAIATLLVPNEIVGGGLTGLAIIAYHLLGIPTGVGLAVMNLPLLWLGWRYMGGNRLLTRSLVGVLVLSLVTDLVVAQGWVPTTDRLLVIFYGGLFNGIGLALVFRGRGTTGGTDILGNLLHRWLDVAVGQAILAINIFVFALAAVFLGLEEAAVALMTSFVMVKSLDSVLHGMSASRSALIVTDRPEEVAATIRLNLHRGVTITPARTGEPGATPDRFLLHVVVARAESARLKRRVEEADPEAFMTISTPNEVLGSFFPEALPKPR